MTCTPYNIKVAEGNQFALVLPLKARTYTGGIPSDTNIDPTHLTDIVVKVDGVVYENTIAEGGVQIVFAGTEARGTYDVVLTAKYDGADIRAAYFQAVTIVAWNYQSDAEEHLPGSPIALQAAYIIGGALTDAELEELKRQYRAQIADAEAAEAAAEAAKEAFDQKAENLDNLDNVAQQGTNPDATLSNTQTAAQGAALNSQIARGYIGTPQSGQPDTLFGAIANIHVDTSTLAQRTDVKDGNDTAISVAKEIRSEVGTGSDTAAESGTLFAVVKWVKDKVKSILNLVGSPASGQPSTLFAAIAAGGGGGGDAQESTSQAILAAVNDILPSQQAVQESYAILEEKGVVVPPIADQTAENLPSTIEQINKSFSGYAYLSAMTLYVGQDYTNLNLSGIVFTGNNYSGINNNNTVRKFVAPHTTTNLTSMSSILHSSSVEEADITNMTTSSVTTCSELAYSATNLQKLNMRGLDFSNMYELGSFILRDCPNLLWVDMTGTKVTKLSTYSFYFSAATSCETVVGDYTIDQVIDGNISILKGASTSFRFEVGTLEYTLNRASLRALINGLADLTGGTAQTLTIGANYIAKLTAEDIAVATNKNWTLA